MGDLVLGPILRHVDETGATVWLETDAPATVEILGHRSETFTVEGHHYALVQVRGLEPASVNPYEVLVDGRKRWPAEGQPASSIRTIDPSGPVRIVFGSCRAALPHDPPHSVPRRASKIARDVDSLYAYGVRMMEQEPSRWPHVLLMLGDQVYVDECFPETRAFIRSRRDTSIPPGEDVLDFEEYTHLYRETWAEPVVRWMLSCVSVNCIFDDHDVIDDWNISASWRADMDRVPWWSQRIESALMSYWIYQHLGNLSFEELAANDMLEELRAAGDGGDVLRRFARRADEGAHGSGGTRWSYSRELGRTRMIVVDSRCNRILDGPDRGMLDDAEWRWIEEAARGDYDHLVIATSLPFLLPHAIHDLETWNEAVCAGRWGAFSSRGAERLRRAIDLEHWSAFSKSFERLTRLIADVGSGRLGPAPRSISVLSGDVHYSYLIRATVEGVRCPVHQVAASPIRNPVSPSIEAAFRFAMSRAGSLIGAALARLGGVRERPLTWEMVAGPWFRNNISTLTLDGASARLVFEQPTELIEARPRLKEEFACELTH